jgi:IS1 family transposase
MVSVVWAPHQAPIRIKASDVSLAHQTSAPEGHCPGKRHTQQIDRQHLTLRTRMKRLVRKIICFSKSTQIPDIVIGLFVNRSACGRYQSTHPHF